MKLNYKTAFFLACDSVLQGQTYKYENTSPYEINMKIPS